VLHTDRRPVLCAALLGVVMALACMIRPTFQVTVPFFAAGAVLARGLTMNRRGAAAAALVVAFAITAGPWLAFNARRDVRGFAEGFGLSLWISLVQQDLLDREYPLPQRVTELYAPVAAKVGGSNEMWAFVHHPEINASNSKESAALLKAWAVDSLLSHPGRWIRRAVWSVGWQLNFFPKGGFIEYQQVRSMVGRVGAEAPGGKPVNLGVGTVTDDVRRFEMHGSGGPLRAVFRWVGVKWPEGFPQIPLCATAILAGAVAIWKRHWALLGVVLASGALVGIHVVMLFHQGRYSLPSWTLWYALSVVPFWALAGAFGRSADCPKPGA
jgi:hypothetical protein